MRAGDYVRYALLNLRQVRGRVIGAGIGVMLAVTFLALALGLGNEFQSVFVGRMEEAFGANKIFVMSTTSLLTEGDIAILRSIPHVASVIPLYSTRASIRAGPVNTRSSVVGIDVTHLGDYLTQEDVIEGALDLSRGTALVGQSVATDVRTGEKLIDVGQIITLEFRGRSLTLTVVGIVGHKPSVGGIDPGSTVLIDVETLRTMLGISGYNVAVVEVDSQNNIEYVLDRVRALLPEAEALSPSAIVQQVRSFFTSLQLFMGVISGVATVIVAMWMYDTMTISVLQRTREIGILKAVGFKRRQIMMLILTEVALVTAGGAFLGVVVAIALSKVVGIPLFNVVIRPLLDPWTLAVPALLAFAVNLLAALGPALRAARLDPVQALRYE